MKTIINRVMLAALFAGYTSIAVAQPTRQDSVSIRIDNRAGVHLILYKPGNPGEQVEKDIRSMGEMLKENKTLPARGSAIINYVPGKYLTVNENTNTEMIILDNGENTAYNFSYQCNIQAQSYFLRILFSDTRELFFRQPDQYYPGGTGFHCCQTRTNHLYLQLHFQGW
ncbi:MAG: hypothetical protein HC905_06790 [Bacteroidales bacterium]|nr:hypothetical protein [Bacteroidales bacterium]